MLDVTKRPGTAPFDTARLDRLMDEAGLDVLLATSKHNVQYLLGGHRSFFFDNMDAMGISRYLPVFVYPKGAPQNAGYFGHGMETYDAQVRPFWVSEVNTKSGGSVDVIQKAAEYVKGLTAKPRRIGVELAFLPADSAGTLRKAFPDAELDDALFVLERLRAHKTSAELEKLRLASELVIDSMLAVIQNHGEGATKAELAEVLRRKETARGLTFDYCLIPAGSRLNRALARVGVVGGPYSEPQDLLSEIEATHQAAFAQIRPGVNGAEIYAAAEPILRKSKSHNHYEFLAHGMGLVSHEAPRLTNSGPVPYDA